jgi:tetratricopeptide (TPR) repeat protein
VPVLIESHVRYDRSLRWALADAYYSQAGAAAWTSGNVPFRATSSYPAARQHALVVARLYRDLLESGRVASYEPFFVLEVGGGLGQFAENFCRALAEGTGDDGRRLLEQLCYVFSDFSEHGLRDVMQRPSLRALVEKRHLVPAIFDLRHPDSLRGLDGEPYQFELGCTIANYLVCVSPPAVLRTRGGVWSERYDRLLAPDAEGTGPADGRRLVDAYYANPARSKLLQTMIVESEWRPVALSERFSHPPHAAALQRLVRGLGDTSIVYPYVFIDLLTTLAERSVRGGMVIVTDYGSPDRDDLLGGSDQRGQRYGNSSSHAVQFPIFDAVAAEAGWSVARTHNPVRSVHAAVLRFQPDLGSGVRGTFHRVFVRREQGEDLIDFRACARGYMEKEEYLNAARFFRRCLRLDPRDAELHYKMGEACLEGNRPRAAYRWLTRGFRLSPEGHDFEFLLGRTCRSLGRIEEAVTWYERSLAREEHKVTLANLGELFGQLGRHKDAYRCLSRAVEVAPDYERARRLLGEFKDAWVRALASAD